MNHGTQLNGGQVCSWSTNSVSPSDRHDLDDARAVEEDVDLEAAHVGRPDAVGGRSRRAAAGVAVVRAQQRPLLVDGGRRRGRPAVLEPVAGRLARGPAPRRRLSARSRPCRRARPRRSGRPAPRRSPRRRRASAGGVLPPDLVAASGGADGAGHRQQRWRSRARGRAAGSRRTFMPSFQSRANRRSCHSWARTAASTPPSGPTRRRAPARRPCRSTAGRGADRLSRKRAGDVLIDELLALGEAVVRRTRRDPRRSAGCGPRAGYARGSPRRW